MHYRSTESRRRAGEGEGSAKSISPTLWLAATVTLSLSPISDTATFALGLSVYLSLCLSVCLICVLSILSFFFSFSFFDHSSFTAAFWISFRKNFSSIQHCLTAVGRTAGPVASTAANPHFAILSLAFHSSAALNRSSLLQRRRHHQHSTYCSLCCSAFPPPFPPLPHIGMLFLACEFLFHFPSLSITSRTHHTPHTAQHINSYI